jgi:hypothetical protein
MATAVSRFITSTDVGADGSVGQASVVARHEALLTDGRRVVIFDDRGWSWSAWSADGTHGSVTARDPWSWESRQDIEETARVVVGPTRLSTTTRRTTWTPATGLTSLGCSDSTE